jgi:hypothetical protein
MADSPYETLLLIRSRAGKDARGVLQFSVRRRGRGYDRRALMTKIPGFRSMPNKSRSLPNWYIAFPTDRKTSAKAAQIDLTAASHSGGERNWS